MKKSTLYIVFLTIFTTISGGISAQQRGYYDAPYTRYEADAAAGNGDVINSTNQNHIAFEASERKVVKLTSGQYREFTASAQFRGIVVRASGATGETATSGINATAKLYVDGTLVATLTFDASYGWKNLQADNNQNYSNVTNGNPRMRYDEQRYLCSASVAAGKKIKIESSSNNLYLDFIEIEDVPVAISAPAGYATYTGGSLRDFIHSNNRVYIPAGNYTLDNYVDAGTGDKIIQGAGKWYTKITCSGNQAGFVGHSNSVQIKDLALDCTNKSRSNSNKGLRGIWGTVSDLWVEHFECGAWIGNYDGGTQANGMHVTNCRFRGNYADGINLCRGSVNCTVSHCNFRNNGDDDMAVWPADNMNCINNTYEYNTAEHCWFASSCACYGGQGNKWQYIIVRDNWEPALRSNTNFGGSGFTGQNTMSNIDVIRCGTYANAYGGGTAAIDIAGGVNVKLECIDISGSLGNNYRNDSGGSVCSVTGVSSNTSCSCTAPVAVTGVTVSPTTKIIAIGEKFTPTATITPTTAANKTVTWSSNSANATVNATTGEVTGVSAGQATITATTQDGNKTNTCVVTVQAVAVQSVSIADASVAINNNVTLTPTFNPTNATNKAVTFSIISGDTYVQLVNAATGEFKGLAAGEATVQVKTTDGNKTATAKITVTNCTATGAYDLIVESVTWTPEYPQVNDKVVFTATIKNQGGTVTPNGQKHGISFTINSQDGQTFYTATWNDVYYTSIPACGTVQLTATGGRNDAPASNYITGGNGWKPTANGTYQVVAFVADNGYVADNEQNRTNNTRTVYVEVGATPPVTNVTKPTLSATTFTYDGNAKSVTVATNTAYTVSGTQSATNAATYTVTVTLNNTTTHQWADGSTTPLNLQWTINKAAAATPTGLTAIYGQTLANVNLPAGWTWVNSATSVGDAGTKNFNANYAGTTNYAAAANVALSVTVRANKEALAQKIAEASALTATEYTVESWNNLAGVLTAAKAVNTNTNASQSEVNSAVQNLQNAINALVKQNPTGIDEVQNSKTIIAYDKTIEVRGIEIGDHVSVYNVAGIRIFSQIATQPIMFISVLPSGVYVAVLEDKNIFKKVVIK